MAFGTLVRALAFVVAVARGALLAVARGALLVGVATEVAFPTAAVGAVGAGAGDVGSAPGAGAEVASGEATAPGSLSMLHTETQVPVRSCSSSSAPHSGEVEAGGVSTAALQVWPMHTGKQVGSHADAAASAGGGG